MDSDAGTILQIFGLMASIAAFITLLGAMAMLVRTMWFLLRMSVNVVRPVHPLALLLWPTAGLYFPRILSDIGLGYRAKAIQAIPWLVVFACSTIALKHYLERIYG